MAELWIPPRLRAGTDEYRKELRDAMSFQNTVCAAWNPELQKIDPYLRLAKAHDNAHCMGVRPGYYHLVRLNPDAPPWVQPLSTTDGRFIEPTSQMLDDLRASDMQNARAMADRAARELRDEQSRERDQARRDEERMDDMLDRFDHLENPRIVVSRDVR